SIATPSASGPAKPAARSRRSASVPPRLRWRMLYSRRLPASPGGGWWSKTAATVPTPPVAVLTRSWAGKKAAFAFASSGSTAPSGKPQRGRTVEEKRPGQIDEAEAKGSAQDQDKDPLVVIVGPTAVGKTKVAIELALRLGGEVVTADSMQVYKGLDIGTDKPSAAERKGVPHHLIDIVEPDQRFNVAQYQKLAHETIQEVHRRGKLPILSGGTGLYVKAVLDEFLF